MNSHGTHTDSIAAAFTGVVDKTYTARYYMNMYSYTCCQQTSLSGLNIESLATTLKIVSEANRLRLLTLLNDSGEHCVCELREHLSDISQSLLSHHLADLRAAELVDSRKEGLRVYYQLTEKGHFLLATVSQLDRAGIVV